MIESSQCLTCFGDASYDYSSDLGTNFLIDDATVSTRKYGSAEVTGFYATSLVCLDQTDTKCVQNFDIFMVTSQTGLPSVIAGIAGLSTDADSKWGPNLIKTLKESGVLSDSLFSFYLSSTSGDSFLDLGAIVPSHM